MAKGLQNIQWKDGDISSLKLWYENGQLEMGKIYNDGKTVSRTY